MVNPSNHERTLNQCGIITQFFLFTVGVLALNLSLRFDTQP